MQHGENRVATNTPTETQPDSADTSRFSGLVSVRVFNVDIDRTPYKRRRQTVLDRPGWNRPCSVCARRKETRVVFVPTYLVHTSPALAAYHGTARTLWLPENLLI